MRITITEGYDRILGTYPMYTWDNQEVVAHYARQGTKRFVAMVDVPDNMSEDELARVKDRASAERDSDVARQKRLELTDQTIMNAGTWQGTEIGTAELQSIVRNYETLKSYFPDSEGWLPWLKDHGESLDSQIGKFSELYMPSDDKVNARKLVLTSEKAIEEYLSGNWSKISPSVRGEYTFDRGDKPETLPGWTMREISFVVWNHDKQLNLMLQEVHLMPGDNQQTPAQDEGKIIQLHEQIADVKNKLQLAEKEKGEMSSKLELAEKELDKLKLQLKEKTVDEVLNRIGTKFLPRDRSLYKEHCLRMNEDELKSFETERMQEPDVVDFAQRSNSQADDTTSSATKAKELARERAKKGGN
jgi:hypothetical protein